MDSERQARIAAVEQRLRDIAVGACGATQSTDPMWVDINGLPTLEQHNKEQSGLRYIAAVWSAFRLWPNSGETFTQLAERIVEAGDD